MEDLNIKGKIDLHQVPIIYTTTDSNVSFEDFLVYLQGISLAIFKIKRVPDREDLQDYDLEETSIKVGTDKVGIPCDLKRQNEGSILNIEQVRSVDIFKKTQETKDEADIEEVLSRNVLKTAPVPVNLNVIFRTGEDLRDDLYLSQGSVGIN